MYKMLFVSLYLFFLPIRVAHKSGSEIKKKSHGRELFLLDICNTLTSFSIVLKVYERRRVFTPSIKSPTMGLRLSSEQRVACPHQTPIYANRMVWSTMVDRERNRRRKEKTEG